MVEIRTQTKVGAVENQYFLLGRAADNTPVIRRMRRELSEYINLDQDGATLQPEVGIYRLTSSINSVSLAAKQGLFQVYNDRDTDITVNATNFADNSTTFILGSGKLLQSRCSMAIAQDSSVSYSYTTLAIDFGRQASASQTPPDTDQYVTAIPDSNSVAPGRYKLVDDQTITLQPFTNGETLPKEWWFWVDDPKTDAVATALFGDISTTIPAKIIATAATSWTTDGSTRTLVNRDEVVKVTLKTAQQTDVDAARTSLSDNALTFDKFYEVERVWTKPGAGTTTTTTPTKKNNLNATREPTVNDDSTQDYEKDSVWIYGDRIWINTDPTAGAAKWQEVTSAGIDPTKTPINTHPGSENNYVDANTAADPLPPGFYLVSEGDSFSLENKTDAAELPKAWYVWNTDTASTNGATLSSTVNDDTTRWYNETTNTLGTDVAGSTLTVVADEIWEITYRLLTTAEQTKLQTDFSLTTAPTEAYWIKRVKEAGAATELNNFGDRTVIRVNQNLDARGFKPFTKYTLHNQGNNPPFQINAGGRFYNLDNTEIAATVGTRDNKLNVQWNFPTTVSTHYAYKTSGGQIYIWNAAPAEQTTTPTGIGRGPTFPTDPNVYLFQLINHVSIEDGLYMRDRDGKWII